MIEYLRGTTDEVTKTDVVRRIGELAERFAPDTQWFLDTMNQVSKNLQAEVSTRHALPVYLMLTRLNQNHFNRDGHQNAQANRREPLQIDDSAKAFMHVLCRTSVA